MISLDSSNIGELEKEYVIRCLEDGEVSTRGKWVEKFEKTMAKYLNVPDTVAVNSGTSALHLCLLTLGIGPDDEVIIPALTFCATYNVVKYVGAIPIIVDIDIDTWCMDFQKVSTEITEKTKAIMPVTLYGNAYDVSVIIERIPIILDACESLGTKTIDNFPIEHYGEYAVLSFNGNKTMTTAGGGLVVGKNLDKIRLLSQQAKANNLDLVGYNYRMTAFSAALGMAQLKRLPSFIKRKKKIREIYENELGNLVTFQKASPYSDPCWWLNACLIPENYELSYVMKKLDKAKIPHRRIFKPLASLPNAQYIYDHGFCLPSSTLCTDKDIMFVCQTIKEILSGK